MPGITPEATFDEARRAMERGDWAGTFACLDPGAVATIARNSLARLLMGDETTLTAICAQHGMPAARIDEIRAAGQRITESAQAMRGRPPDPATMREQSLAHKRLVDEYRKSQDALLKSAPDLARFAAAMERAFHAAGAGGSVSSRLFVGETLTDVESSGNTARAVRRGADGFSEKVGFARRKGAWYIRPFARVR